MVMAITNTGPDWIQFRLSMKRALNRNREEMKSSFLANKYRVDPDGQLHDPERGLQRDPHLNPVDRQII
jgi:hypothetical protein